VKLKFMEPNEIARTGVSTIKNAGSGVFAKIDIERGTTIYSCTGKSIQIATHGSIFSRSPGLNDGFSLFGKGFPTHQIKCADDLIKYMESKAIPEYIEESKEKANVDYKIDVEEIPAKFSMKNWFNFKCKSPVLPDSLTIVAIKDIKKGEEMFYHYGIAEWLFKFWIKTKFDGLPGEMHSQIEPKILNEILDGLVNLIEHYCSLEPYYLKPLYISFSTSRIADGDPLKRGTKTMTMQETKGYVTKPAERCSMCGLAPKGDNTALFRCSKCKSAQYCGKNCQAKHWPEHKLVCKKVI